MMEVGFLELLADAVPGIVLRLSSHPATSYFDVRLVQPWSPTPSRDQQSAGGILWAVAELLDLPFLVLVFARWIRADAREAEAVDAALDAASSPATDPAEADETSKPWWLTDPQLRDRYRNT
jgi:putative membrane protein